MFRFKACIKIIQVFTAFVFFVNCEKNYSYISKNTFDFAKIDFHKAMQPSFDEIYYYHPAFIQEKLAWKKAYDLYNKNFVNNNFTNKELLIPKKIHQIWLGSDLPYKHRKMQATWLKYHPEWEYKLWTDKDIEELGLYNKQLYDQAVTYAEKADIARYEILYRFGGLYVDTDFECIQPFDIFNYNLEFYAGIEYNKELRVNNALIAAKPAHPILKKCVEKIGTYPIILKPHLTPRQIYIETLVQKTGPAYFTRVIFEEIDNTTSLVLFPNTFFYPFNSGKQLLAYSFIKPETFAMHHWDMSWVKRLLFYSYE